MSCNEYLLAYLLYCGGLIKAIFGFYCFKQVAIALDSLQEPSGKIGTIQRRLAWPLRKDDTHKSSGSGSGSDCCDLTRQGPEARTIICAYFMYMYMCVRACVRACVCVCVCVSICVCLHRLGLLCGLKCVDSLAGLPRNACILLGIYTALRPSGCAAPAASTNGCVV